jgi:HEAT repeat protein
MRRHQNQKLLSPLLWLICFFALATLGRAQGLYQQCETLSPKPGAEAEVMRQLAALKDKEAKTRIEAAQRLAKTCDARAAQPLIALLKDEDPLARVAAVEALGQLGDRASIEPLIEAINDSDWRVRVALARSLCSFQYREASVFVLNGLGNPDGKPKDENDLRARCAALIAVNHLRDVAYCRKAVTLLFGYLEDEREALRQVAEQAMLELKSTRNGKYELMGLLKQSNSPQLRRTAAYWLGRLGIQEARRTLGEASVGDRDARVRDAAAEALALLKKDGGQ